MTYNPQYPAQPQPNYGQGQGYPPGAPGQPQQGYPAPQGYGGYAQQPQQTSTSFADMYAGGAGQGGLLDEKWFPAVVTEAGFGRTAKGDKWMWTVKVALTDPMVAGRELTGRLTLSPKKKNGEDNPRGLDATFSELHALGVPVGQKYGDQQAFWDMYPPQPGETPDQAMARQGATAAQMMAGRPVRIKVKHEETEEWGTQVRLDHFAEPKPGDPATVPQAAPAQPQAPAMGGYQPGPVAPGYAQPGPQPVGGQQPPWAQQGQAPQPQYSYGSPPQTTAQPVPPGYQPPGGAPPQSYQAPQGPVAPQPWQGQPAAAPQPSGPPQQPAAGPPAQQAPVNPGQPGMGQFMPQGQPDGQQPPGTGQAPPQPPWAQQPPQQG